MLIILKPFSCFGLLTYPLFVPPGQEKSAADGWVRTFKSNNEMCPISLRNDTTCTTVCSSVALWFPDWKKRKKREVVMGVMESFCC